MVGAPVNTPSLVIRFNSAVNDPKYHGAHQLQLSVPQTIGRNGLRSLLYHLLNLSSSESKPEFSFLVNDEPLRTTLDKFLSRRQLSIEETLNVTYYLPIPEPIQHEPQKSSNEWLSCLSVHSDKSLSNPIVLVGSYSGTPSALQGDSTVFSENSVRSGNHTAAIKAICWLPQSGGTKFLTASHDQTAQVWSIDHNKDNTNTRVIPMGTFRSGDAGSATMFSSACVNKTGNGSAALGGEDGSLWIIHDLTTIENESTVNVGSKRDMVDTPSLEAKRVGSVPAPLPITAMDWDNDDVVTTGWDGLTRIWDMSEGKVKLAIPCGGKAITGLGIEENMMVVSCVDGAIRLIDKRDGKGVIGACTRKNGHKGIASGVNWLENQRTIVSGGLDGEVKFWDIRGMLSPSRIVQDVHGEKGKSLGIGSGIKNDGYEVFSVGSDGRVGRISL